MIHLNCYQQFFPLFFVFWIVFYIFLQLNRLGHFESFIKLLDTEENFVVNIVFVSFATFHFY